MKRKAYAAAPWALLLCVVTSSHASEPIITTVAGTGPDNLPASVSNVWSPITVTPDPAGGYLVTASEANRIYRIDAGGRLSILAGADSRAGFLGDGGPARAGRLKLPEGMALVAGSLYVSDTGNQRVRRIDGLTGILATVAGDGTAGYGGDSGPASSARLNNPRGLAADTAGRLYIVDQGNQRIRRIDTVTGVITTVVGTGFGTGAIDGPGGDPRDDLGDGGPAASASVRSPTGIGVDEGDNLFIADTGNQRIRRVDAATGIITTLAGSGVATGSIDGPGGDPADDFRDGIVATSATLLNPAGVATSPGGEFVIADTGNRRVRRVSGGIITTSAGTGLLGSLGDGGPATSASLSGPRSLGFDANGDLLIADPPLNRVRRVDHVTGIITTAAGNGSGFFSGEGTPALTAMLGPAGIAADPAGNLFVADPGNARVRRIDAGTGIVTTVAGTGAGLDSGDGGPATAAGVRDPQDVAVDAAGNRYIAEQASPTIRKVEAATGLIRTVAGTGLEGFSGDGGPATLAAINRPVGLTVDGPGNIFIADRYNSRIRRVDAASGIITTIAGNGGYGFAGDGGPATSAVLGLPVDVTLDATGNLFISDQCNHRVRRIDRLTGVITTVAGNGPGAVPGDGCRTAPTVLMNPMGIRFDAAGNLFVADLGGAAIRRIDAVTGAVTTVAGNGVFDRAGDGGPATAASLLGPVDMTVDAAGHVLIADSGRLRRVGQDSPPLADAGPDVQAECTTPQGAVVHLDGSGSTDPDSSPGTKDDIAAMDWFTNPGLPSQTWLGAGTVLDAALPLGESTVTLVVTDRAGLSARDTLVADVPDPTPPAVTVQVAPSELWPPNHRLVAVHASVTASDACGGTSVVLDSISSSEPDDAPGSVDGSTTGDIRNADVGVADLDFLLRAERSGQGSGRTYTVRYRATDSAGNGGTGAATVTVPLERDGMTDPLILQMDSDDAGTTATWSAVNGAVSYNVIRARLGNVVRTADVTSLGDVVCLAGGTGATSTAGQEDALAPPVGDVFLYYVESFASGWSGYGTESSPLPVEPASGDCP